jgi:hypothetical protein
MATNQVARYAPSLYVRATRQTGRGSRESEDVEQIAAYFRGCVDDYFAVLGIARDDGPAFIDGKAILEYGPGDLPGVAVLLIAFGARTVDCVDRFPMVSMSEKNVRVLDRLLRGLPAPARERLERAFVDAGEPASGLRADRVRYVVRPHGLSGLDAAADLVISRAVLEHVEDLPAVFADMARAMKPGALAAHQVDLKSHGLHRDNPLDFLTVSPALWALMYSHKGVPNRWRVDRYREILRELPVDVVKLEPTSLASPTDVDAVRGELAPPFRAATEDDLAWLGFWLVFRKRAG